MRIRKTPILSEAINKLRTIVEEHNEAKLSSVRILAKQIGISIVTLLKALSVLREEGLIEGRWGKGFYIISKKSSFDHVNLCIRKIDKVKDTASRIKRDIIEGSYNKNQTLPSIKSLTEYYNVSYPTIKKVLSLLSEEGIVIQRGIRYYLFSDQTKSIMSRIAIVAFGTKRNTIKIVTEREQNFYRLLSGLARDNNVFLETVCYNDYLEKPQFYTPDDTPLDFYLKNKEINGIILSTYHMRDSTECLRRLLTFNIPISVWVEDHSILKMINSSISNRKKLCFFDSSYSTLPGFEVGKYLISKGHKNIAYISPFHGSMWSQNRLLGLKKAAAASSNVNIYPFVKTKYLSEYFFFEKVVHKSYPLDNFPFQQISEELCPFLKERISSLLYEYNTLLRDNMLFSICEELMKEALQNSSITAWVCANDLVAVLINDFWNYSALPLSERPALIGFDNSFDSFQRNITSYEFNTYGEIQQMLNHLLYPNSSSLLSRKSSIRVSGIIVERVSSMKSL